MYVPGNEEVRVAILLALGAWLSRAGSSCPAGCVKFFCLGLKEKDTLRRAHLRCLRLAFQNSDILTEVSALCRYRSTRHVFMFFLFECKHIGLQIMDVVVMFADDGVNGALGPVDKVRRHKTCLAS